MSMREPNAAGQPSPPQDLTGLLVAGRYEILSLLGVGGFASVWKARQVQPEGLVAIKVLHPAHSADPALVEDFLREAALYVPFRDEPNIATILDCGHDRSHGVHFLVMTLLEETADSIIEKRGALPAERCFRLAEDVGSALASIHRAGIVHRDVKGSNVMTVPGRGRFVLSDFGIGMVQEVAEKTAGTRALNTGTWSYASPEQIRARKKSEIGAPSDLYSLGVLLFRAATGEYPFRPEFPQVIHHHLETPPPDPRTINPAVPAELAHIILRCLAKNPEKRHASASELVRAARKGRKSGQHTQRGRAPARSRRLRLVPLAAAIAVVACGAIAFAASIAGKASPVLHSEPEGASYRLFEGARKQFSEPVAHGITPARLGRLRHGLYTIVMEEDGFLPIEQQISISGSTQELALAMSRAVRVSVSGTPGGAAVALTALESGSVVNRRRAPCVFESIPEGAYQVKIEHPGYRTRVDTLRATADGGGELRYALQALAIEAGAERVDGTAAPTVAPPAAHAASHAASPRSAGESPDLLGRSAGRRGSALPIETARGPVEGSARAGESGAAGSPRTVEIRLRYAPSFVFISIDSDSTRAINEARGMPPYTARLAAGSHMFRLWNPDRNIEVTIPFTIDPAEFDRPRTLILDHERARAFLDD